MFIKRIGFVLGMFVAMMLTACQNYSIDSPAAGSIQTVPPAEFIVGYTTQPQALPAILLNRYNVEQYFSAGESDARALGSDLEPYLIEGENVFQETP